MTIEKGQSWGSACSVPDHRIIVSSDRDLARCGTDELISLTGGDLWKSLGCPPAPPLNSRATQLPIDAIRVTFENHTSLLAASSIEVGFWLRRGRYVCIANTSFIGNRNVAPRAHPNDGSLDLLEIHPSMTWRQRWVASRRALTGTHVPHPCITTRRIKEFQIDRRLSETLRIDGVTIADWRSIHVEIEPDHWQVIV